MNIKTFSINLLLCFLVYALFEYFSGEYKNKKVLDLNHNYLVINKSVELDVPFYTPEPIKIKYHRDSYGLKDRFKDINKVDIVTVGGSTTEQRYLSVENTWTDILEKNINKNNKDNIDIVNAGISGQSSKGHIWNFNNWFKNIKGFKPKYVIFYMGINENESNNLYGAKGDPQPYQENSDFKNKLKNFFKKNNGITYRIYLKATLHKSDLMGVWHNQWRIYQPYKKIDTDTKKFKNITFDIIKKRLKNLNKLSNEIGATPIFVTQKTLRWKKEGKTVYSIDAQDHYYNEMNIAKTVMSFCKKNNLQCIDGFNNLDFTINDTWDLIHISPSGSKKIAALIYQELYLLF